MLLNMSKKNWKVEIINPSKKQTKYRQNQKHPLKVKNLKVKKKHYFLRIPVIFGVVFLLCPKSLF